MLGVNFLERDCLEVLFGEKRKFEECEECILWEVEKMSFSLIDE